MKWMLLAVGVAANASASLLIKVAVTPPRRFPQMSDPGEALRNWPLWLGLFLYFGAFLVYAGALTRFPMNIAHPVMTSATIAAVACASSVVLKEPLSLATLSGLMLVIVGVILITAQAR